MATVENNELFAELVHEYDRRLEEQVRLAKADMLHELEAQINVSDFILKKKKKNCRPSIL